MTLEAGSRLNRVAAGEVVVVTGLPRSGTSLVMRMLAAGGLDLVADATRRPDDDNPHGYFESDLVRRLDVDARWLFACGRRGVKILSHLLRWIPDSLPVRVLFVHRAIDEVIASQEAMIARRRARGESPADQRVRVADSGIARLRMALEGHRRLAGAALAARGFAVLDVQHRALIESPHLESRRIAEFLERDLDTRAMSAAVDPALHRHRSPRR